MEPKDSLLCIYSVLKAVLVQCIIPVLYCFIHHRDINNGVYRAGFAGAQGPYDTAVREVFAALDRVEGLLSNRRYLTGSCLTEADIRLYTTLVRFDPVYVGHFKVAAMSFYVISCHIACSAIRRGLWTIPTCGTI